MWKKIKKSCCYSISQFCPTLCNPMDCSTPGFSVLHQLLEFVQTHVHWISDAIQPSHPLLPPFPCLQSFPASESFPMSRLFASGSQITGASASILPMNIQSWFPLVLTGLTSLQSKGLSRVFSSTIVGKHQFFGALPSLWPSFYILYMTTWKKDHSLNDMDTTEWLSTHIGNTRHCTREMCVVKLLQSCLTLQPHGL